MKKFDYKFSKAHGGPIDMAEADEWMKRYKAKNPQGPWAFFFGSDIINKVLSHPEAVGMRVYLGLAKDDNLKMVLLGAREDGSNITPIGGKDGGGGTAGDDGKTCPPYCP